MTYKETKIPGVIIIEIDRIEDERGFFARTWDEREAKEHGIRLKTVQCNTSFNTRKGTLRGMHYQEKPYEEAKLVRCTQGALYDVVLDLRRNSPSYRQWVSIELTAENRRTVYIPEGLAHGFQTLVDNTEVFYQMGEYFHPGSALSVRFDDPAFNITWPEVSKRFISEKDRSYPDWKV